MKIVIGIIVVLGLGWLLLGMGSEDVETPEVADTEEVMEENSMAEGDEAMMEEGDHSDDTMMEEGDDTMMEEGDTAMEDDTMMEEETPAQ